MGARLELAGQRFGRLTVVSRSANAGRHTRWACRCDCGRSVVTFTTCLRSGATTSCGCAQKECASETCRREKTSHGMTRSPEYSVWCGLKRRCENPRERCYPRYGGAGIKCRFTSFEHFLEEVGPRPGAGYSIDRIDPSKHYEPGNVRWATHTQQARNKKSTLLVSINGRRRPLADWCDETGVSYQKAWGRIKRRGWSPERAVSTP